MLSLVVLGVLIGIAWRKQRYWRLWFLPNLHAQATDTSGYEMEPLPFVFNASFVRGDRMWFTKDGQLFVASADAPQATMRRIGKVHATGRLFVTRRGTILVSCPVERHVIASHDGGKTWRQVLSWPARSFEEAGDSAAIFTGNYTTNAEPFAAVVMRSKDEGRTWQRVFEDKGNHHVHVVRHDPQSGRVYIAIGDRYGKRGQFMSPDLGETWQRIVTGRGEGHTGVAFSGDRTVWGSDDGLGRIILDDRRHPTGGTAIAHAPGLDWFWVSGNDAQLFAGGYLRRGDNPQGGSLLIGSSDQGRTWRVLMRHSQGSANDAYTCCDSRSIASSGWLYFRTSEGKAYRVRRAPR